MGRPSYMIEVITDHHHHYAVKIMAFADFRRETFLQESSSRKVIVQPHSAVGEVN